MAAEDRDNIEVTPRLQEALLAIVSLARQEPVGASFIFDLLDRAGEALGDDWGLTTTPEGVRGAEFAQDALRQLFRLEKDGYIVVTHGKDRECFFTITGAGRIYLQMLLVDNYWLCDLMECLRDYRSPFAIPEVPEDLREAVLATVKAYGKVLDSTMGGLASKEEAYGHLAGSLEDLWKDLRRKVHKPDKVAASAARLAATALLTLIEFGVDRKTSRSTDIVFFARLGDMEWKSDSPEDVINRLADSLAETNNLQNRDPFVKATLELLESISPGEGVIVRVGETQALIGIMHAGEEPEVA